MFKNINNTTLLKKLIIILIIHIFSIQLFGQSNVIDRDTFTLDYSFLKDPIIKGRTDFVIAYNGVNHQFGEVGISRGYRGYEGWSYVYSAYHLTTEFSLSDYSKTIGPKIGYSTSIAFVYFGGYFIYYIDLQQDKYQLFFRPEIGPTLFGLGTLFYGYNFGATSNTEFSKNIIGLKVTIGKGVLKGITR